MFIENVQRFENAFNLVDCGVCNKMEIERGIIIYKVPTADPNKYTIRIDIKIDKSTV